MQMRLAAGLAALIAVVVVWWYDVSAPSSKHSSHREIPLVQLGAASQTQVDAWRTGAQLGVVRLAGHGVDVSAALNASRALFSLPDGVKVRSEAARDCGVPCGARVAAVADG